MTIEDIRSYRNAQPFEPFDIVMNDGTKFHVALSKRIALSPNGRAAYVFEGNDLSEVEVARVVALQHPRNLPPSVKKNA